MGEAAAVLSSAARPREMAPSDFIVVVFWGVEDETAVISGFEGGRPEGTLYAFAVRALLIDEVLWTW
jgi:hypothetical protein